LPKTLTDDTASGKPHLEYPFEVPPNRGATLDVAPGVRWIRMPLPYALDHVNLWAIDEANGCAVIDTGLNNEETLLAWQTILNNSDKGIRKVTRVLLTHMHADHVGLAGWLTEMSDSELWMTRLEYLTCRLTFSEGKSSLSFEAKSFYRCAGWSEKAISALEVHAKRVAACVSSLPGNVRRLHDGQILKIGAHAWTVIVGGGHSPEHACFYCPNLKVLISGDHVLPKISSNISVLHTEPDENPMADWYTSLRKLKKMVPDDVLVLPSHNLCFRGLHARIDYLLNSQDRTLERLQTALQQPKRAVDVFCTLFGREIGEADASTLRMATGESIACLNYLLHSGSVKKELRSDGVAWYSVTGKGGCKMGGQAHEERRDPFLTGIGERVRLLRANCGLTRRALANEANVSERYLANLENGAGNASVMFLRQLTKALNCTLEDILGDETTLMPDWSRIRELLGGKDRETLTRARIALESMLTTGPRDPHRRERIALIGLRGAGKSTLGRMLANELNVVFVELTLVIEQLAGCPSSEIHTLYGPNAYRRYERRALDSVFQQYTGAVIASPGGLVSEPATLKALLAHCFTVWLQATPQDHMHRVIAQGDLRSMAENTESMEDLKRILGERGEFYSLADMTFDTSGKTLGESYLSLREGLAAQLTSV